jgi:hypothetical protein
MSPWAFRLTGRGIGSTGLDPEALIARLEARISKDYLDGQLLVKDEFFECEQRLK